MVDEPLTLSLSRTSLASHEIFTNLAAPNFFCYEYFEEV